MPGLILGKLDEWGRTIQGHLSGMVIGDEATAEISPQEVLDLAQYLQQMGYDIQGYGLGNVEYEDDGKTTNQRRGAAKEIKAITKSVDGKEYLLSYIAANENTYRLAQTSILGELKSAWNNLFSLVYDDIEITTSKDFSTGMLEFPSNLDKHVAIDRDSKQLKVYQKGIEIPETGSLGLIGIITRLIKGDTKVQWGDTFSYDLENWAGRYGRPTELFLALHLSTMMPDLTYEIATADAFNTKLKMGLLDVNVAYETTATKEDSTLSQDEILNLYDTYCTSTTNNSDDLIPETKWTYAEIIELAEVANEGINASAAGETEIEEWGRLGDAPIPFSSVAEDDGHFTKYKELTDEQIRNIAKVCCREQGSDDWAGIAAEASFMANFYENVRKGQVYDGTPLRPASFYEFVRYDLWFGGRNAGTMDSQNGAPGNPVNDQATEIVRQVLVYGKRTLPIYIDEHDFLGDIAYIENNGAHLDKNNKNNYIKDVTILHQDTSRIVSGGQWTFYSFPSEDSDPFGYHEKYGGEFHYEFDESSATSSSGKGISIKWPFIGSVTNHWYYNDIDFTKDVYRFAKSATKTIDYIPDDENNALNKGNVSVKLDATLTSSIGMIYQVAEPEATGPNDNIKKLFQGEYYKYDGTVDTAKRIANAKAVDLNKNTFDFNGAKYSVEKADVEKEKVSFKNNKGSSLAAFGILQSMHTEASDYIYRNLKELMVSLDYFSEEELTEEAKNIMLWPIQTENKESEWETVKDQNNFGTIIKCNDNETTIIAPSDAKVKYADGSTITLEFTTLNDESAKLLEYIFKQKDQYTKINKDILTGLEMTIKGISLDSSIAKDGKVTRGQLLGTASGAKDGSPAISITMTNLDKSLIENLNEYLRQEENTKYEAIMQAKMLMKDSYTQSGVDVSALLTASKSSTNSNSSLAMITDVKISREDFIKKCEEYQAKVGGTGRDFAQNAGAIYDTCKENGINPVWAAAHGWLEQGWKSPSGAKYNWWGLGIYDGMSTSVLGNVGGVEAYVKKYCDHLHQRLNGENYVIEGSKQAQKYYPDYYTGGVGTVYDVFVTYRYVDITQEEARHQIFEYVNPLISQAKTIFGDDIFASTSYDSSTAPANVREFVNKAMQAVGSEYVSSGYIWTGNPGTSKFTCSGLIDFALGRPSRSSSPESLKQEVVNKGNYKTSINDLQFGDLIFFKYAGRSPGHVGIYLGNQTEVHAGGTDEGPGMAVCIHKFSTEFFMGGGSIF